MKLFVVAIVLVCLALTPTTSGGGIRRSGQPPQVLGSRLGRATNDKEAPVLRSQSEVRPDGYNYAFETGNGITAEESGKLKKVGEVESIDVQGQAKYSAPDGTVIDLTYTADENGFHPAGEHLPVAPPIPEDIARALKYIEAHPPPVENFKKP